MSNRQWYFAMLCMWDRLPPDVGGSVACRPWLSAAGLGRPRLVCVLACRSWIDMSSAATQSPGDMDPLGLSFLAGQTIDRCEGIDRWAASQQAPYCGMDCCWLLSCAALQPTFCVRSIHIRARIPPTQGDTLVCIKDLYLQGILRSADMGL